MRSSILAMLGCLVLLGIEELVHAGVQGARAEKAVAAARAFEATLSAEQRAALRLAFDDPARTQWSFVPGERKGLAFAKLDERGRIAAHQLLAVLLSARGYLKVVGIVDLESTLREIEKSEARDPGRYWLTFFGEPGSAAWSVRFEGHHISLNLSGQAGEWSGVTPLFLGANPACVERGPKAGLRILGREEELARELFLGLDEKLRARATLAGAVPAEVILAPGRAGGFEKLEGLPFADLPPAARDLFRELLEEIVGDLAPQAAEFARARLAPDKLCFAWSGGVRAGEPHYWRISGPEASFELDNVQGGANHVHRLWRDKARDFGGDALLEHYRAEHQR